MYFEVGCSLIHSVKACCLHRSQLYKSIAEMIILYSKLCIFDISCYLCKNISVYREENCFASYCFLSLFFSLVCLMLLYFILGICINNCEISVIFLNPFEIFNY